MNEDLKNVGIPSYEIEKTLDNFSLKDICYFSPQISECIYLKSFLRNQKPDFETVDAKKQVDLAVAHAIIRGDKEWMDLFIHYGVNINDQIINMAINLGLNPSLTSKQATAEFVQDLLSPDANPDLLDSLCGCPLESTDYALSEMQAALNQERKIMALVKHNINIKDLIFDGFSLFRFAFEKDYWEIIDFLIGHGYSIDDPDSKGNTLLHHAFRKKDHNKICALLNRGADAKRVSENGTSRGHLAVRHNITSVIPLLVEKGLDIDAKNNQGETAFHRALMSGKKEAVDDLQTKGNADITIPLPLALGSTLLHEAAKAGFKELALFYLDLDKQAIHFLDNHGETPLHYALKSPLSADGPFINKMIKAVRDKTPSGIFDADKFPADLRRSIFNQLSIYDLNRFSRVNRHANQIFQFAIVDYAKINTFTNFDFKFTVIYLKSLFRELKQPFLDKMILSKNLWGRGDGDKWVCSPASTLRYLVNLNSNELFEIFANEEFYSSKNGSIPSLKMFFNNLIQSKPIEKKLNPNATQYDLHVLYPNAIQALYLASKHGKVEIIEFVLKHGFNADTGKYLLHEAVENGHLDCIPVLIAGGVDINQKNLDRLTPLHVAVSKSVSLENNEQVAIVNALLERGADPSILLPGQNQSSVLQTAFNSKLFDCLIPLTKALMKFNPQMAPSEMGSILYRICHYQAYNSKHDMTHIIRSLADLGVKKDTIYALHSNDKLIAKKSILEIVIDSGNMKLYDFLANLDFT